MGLFKRDAAQEELRSSIVAHPERYPRWFVRMTRQEGIIYWAAARAEPYVPERVRATDVEITARLPGNPGANTMAQAVVANQYKRAVVHFALEQPRKFLAGTFQSYQMFWLPIREYARMIAGPIFVRKNAVDLWREEGMAGFLRGAYDRDNFQILQRMRYPIFANDGANLNGTKPGSAFALPHAPFLMYLFNAVAIHVLGPLLLLALWLGRKNIGIDRRLPVFLYLAYAYLAVVSSVGEHGENHRFRLAAEPVIWLSSIIIAVGWWRFLRGVRG